MIMRLSMRFLGAITLLGAGALVSPASVAHASLSGPCEATGTFQTGTKSDGSFTVNAKSLGSATVVIPREDTVNWTGAVDVPAQSRSYSGSITVKLPPGFGSVTIDSWNSTSDNVANDGVEEYQLPSLVPAGVTFVVSGQHQEPGATCAGTVHVKIEGGAFDSPLAPVSLVLTGLSGAGFVAVIRPMFRRIV